MAVGVMSSQGRTQGRRGEQLLSPLRVRWALQKKEKVSEKVTGHLKKIVS